jgi:lantibiotic leader peptide-processing serine protease
MPHRYLAVYRNAAVAGDAESRTSTRAARLVHRNDRSGMAIVDACAFSTNDHDQAMRRLAAQPNVEQGPA